MKGKTIMSHFKQRLLMSLAFFAVVVCFLLLPQTTAQASSGPKTLSLSAVHVQTAASTTCVGSRCMGTDPYTTRCAASGSVVTFAESYPLRIELLYSPVCQTNWTQAYWLDGAARTGWGASIQRFSGPDGRELYELYWTPNAQWWINTNQYYAPQNKAQSCLYPYHWVRPLCTNRNLG